MPKVMFWYTESGLLIALRRLIFLPEIGIPTMLELLKKFLWTIPFICFISGYLILSKIYPVKEIEAPAVIGKSLQEACSILSQHALNARLVASKEDPLLADGTIISQTPAAGQKIKPNQTVFIVASHQPEKNLAPDYTHKQLSEIEQDIVAKNIRAKSYAIPSNACQNACIAQWPEAGLPLEHNKMILYVAQPMNKPILIPHLKNKPVRAVVDFLKTNSIQVEIIHDASMQHDKHSCIDCIVLDQRPLAGSIVTHDVQKPVRMQLHVAQR